MKRLLAILKKLLLLAVFGLILMAYDGWEQINIPLRLSEPQTLELPQGGNLQSVVAELSSRGAWSTLRQRYYLLAYGRFTRAALQLKAGEYELTPASTPKQVLELLVSGKSKQYSFTIVEGWTAAEVFTRLAQQTAITHILPADPATIMQALGEPALHPEGLFYPDTYNYPRGTTDLEFLKRARGQMQQVLDEEWTARAPELPLSTPYEALILASIVERETGLSIERPLIAGVFVRRLQKGMMLQTDPTVIYGLGAKFDGNLRRADLQADTSYNTYTRVGLPPTPIALPGRAAINAALHPTPDSSLYFVAKGDGSHVFSATIEEHEAAVRQYQLKQPASVVPAAPTTP
ncbi:MAG: endolytic transglycosylase MltG [Nevskiales bacterium]